MVDYGFYLIQRGEAGHRRGAYLSEYKDSGGIETIGYGTVTRPGYNSLNYRENTVTEEQAIDLAKQEMAVKINEKCRTKFKDFDNLLPCYQAAILDTTYQGNWGMIQKAMNEHDMQAVYQAIIDNPNRERAAVRGRAIEMGMLIEQALQMNPNADPRRVAELIAQQMIEQYAYLNGTDCELSKDELALLYRSCMAAYGVEVSEEEIEQFALNYDNVATGMCGIGSMHPAGLFSGIIPQSGFYDGSLGTPYVPGYANNRGVSSGYRSFGDRYTGYMPPVPFLPAEIGPNRFQPDSSALEISTSDVSYNFSSRNGAKPQMIVLHTTESPSYRSTKATFQSRASKVSAHYVIDRDGTIHQFLPEGYSAWHAGDSKFPPLGITGSCNPESIGIEIQRAPSEPLTKEQIASTMALVKDIKERHNIPAEHVVAHSDVAPGRKSDPGADFPWEAFAREGLATMNHLGVGGTHAQHINPSLAAVSSADCQFYIKPDYEKKSVSIENAEEERKRVQLAEQSKAEIAAIERNRSENKKPEPSLKQTLEHASIAGNEERAVAETGKVLTSNDTPEKSVAKSSGKKSAGKKKKSGSKSKSKVAKNDNESAIDQTETKDVSDQSKDDNADKVAQISSEKKALGENITNKSESEEKSGKIKSSAVATR